MEAGLHDFANVLPWGRALDEYRAMFALEALPIASGSSRPRILDVGAGPASFAAEMHALGVPVTACDPLYVLSAAEIAARIEDARREIMALVRDQQHRFDWSSLGSPAALERKRLAAMDRFLADYEEGLAAGRYRTDALPDLGFPDRAFDLALSSHFLFTWSEPLDGAFHLAGIRELCRVAREVRIFPLLDMDGVRSRHLEPVTARLKAEGHACEILTVPYEFQIGGDQMLRVKALISDYDPEPS